MNIKGISSATLVIIDESYVAILLIEEISRVNINDRLLGTDWRTVA